MKNLTNIILIIVILFIAGLFYWALFIPKEEVTQKIYATLKEQEKRADLSFKKVTFEEVSSGVKYWELSAQTAMINKDQGIASLKQVDGTFFKKGKASLKFNSPSARWDMKKREIMLDQPFGYDIALKTKLPFLLRSAKKNPASVFNLPKSYRKEPGYWFQAKNLSWKMADEKIICSGGIVLNKAEVSGYADKLSGDVALEKVALEGKPYIIIRPEKSSPITVEAEAFEVVSLNDTFLATGHPRIIWETAIINADEVKYLQAAQRLDLNGNVSLNYNDIRAAGDSSSYFTFLQQVLLRGKAWAEQGNNRLSGDKIIVRLKDRKIYLSGKSKVVITEEELKK